jgi:hypothetical protein
MVYSVDDFQIELKIMNRRTFLTRIIATLAALPFVRAACSSGTDPLSSAGSATRMTQSTFSFSSHVHAVYVASDYDPQTGIWPDRTANGNDLCITDHSLISISNPDTRKIEQCLMHRYGIS